MKNEKLKGGEQVKKLNLQLFAKKGEEVPGVENILNVRCELVNETETSVDIYLYGRIVDEKPINWWTGKEEDGEFIYPENIRTLVKEAGEKDINLHINSGGGSIYASIAINNFLKQCSNRINIYIDGVAASGASIIAMAGDEINMPINTTMMIHRAAVGVYGNADELKKVANTLEKFDETVLNSYKNRFIGTVEELKQLIAEETYLTAEECKTFGLCDNLLGELKEEIEEVVENEIPIKVSLFEKYKVKAETPKETLFNKFKNKGEIK